MSFSAYLRTHHMRLIEVQCALFNCFWQKAPCYPATRCKYAPKCSFWPCESSVFWVVRWKSGLWIFFYPKRLKRNLFLSCLKCLQKHIKNSRWCHDPPKYQLWPITELQYTRASVTFNGPWHRPSTNSSASTLVQTPVLVPGVLSHSYTLVPVIASRAILEETSENQYDAILHSTLTNCRAAQNTLILRFLKCAVKISLTGTALHALRKDRFQN